LKKIFFFFCVFPVSSYPRQKNSAEFLLLLLCACSTKPKKENKQQEQLPTPTQQAQTKLQKLPELEL
jgi:hypothetical protein